MKRTDYIHIQGWMVSDLKLKGNELLVFATIHGFSKDGVNKYRGSISYVSEFISISKRSVVTILSNLVEKGYVSKEENPTGNLFQSLFFGDEFEVVKKLHRGSEKVAQVSSEETSPLSSEKVAYNNNKHNNKNTYNNMEFEFFKNPLKDKKNKKEKPTKEKVLMPFDSENFIQQWQVWKDYKFKEHGFRYKSTTSEQAALKKLSELSHGMEQKAIKIIHESISNGWKGFFELKTNNDGKKQALNELGSIAINWKRNNAS
jgi:hypothetical protein